jgi:hypothetical protein
MEWYFQFAAVAEPENKSWVFPLPYSKKKNNATIGFECNYNNMLAITKFIKIVE